MQEMLRAAHRAGVLLLEGDDGRRSPPAMRPRSPRLRCWSRWRCSCAPPLPPTQSRRATVAGCPPRYANSSREVLPSREISPSRVSGPSSTEIDSTPSTGLAVMSVAPVSKKPDLRIDFRHCCRLLDRLERHRRHLAADTAARWRRSRRPRRSSRPGSRRRSRRSARCRLLADAFQRLPSAGRGRLVDRVDDVDVGALLQAFSIAVRPFSWSPSVISSCRCAGSSSSPYLVGVLHVDAEACHEALVAQIVDGRLVGGEVEEDDLGVLGLVAERRLAPTGRSARRP